MLHRINIYASGGLDVAASIAPGLGLHVRAGLVRLGTSVVWVWVWVWACAGSRSAGLKPAR
ncbi:MAG: hypothetical protein Q605_AUC00037G0001, partial [Actinomyces urogenitalis DORA_12]